MELDAPHVVGAGSHDPAVDAHRAREAHGGHGQVEGVGPGRRQPVGHPVGRRFPEVGARHPPVERRRRPERPGMLRRLQIDGVEAPVEPDHRDPVGVGGRRHGHRPRLRDVTAGRLLTEDVQSHARRLRRHLGVDARRQDRGHRVDLGRRRPPVGGRGHAEAGRRRLGLVGVDIGDHHLHQALVLEDLQRREVGGGGDRSAADQEETGHAGAPDRSAARSTCDHWSTTRCGVYVARM